jgi:hypothetical protein
MASNKLLAIDRSQRGIYAVKIPNHLQSSNCLSNYRQNSMLKLFSYHKVDILATLDYRRRNVRVNFGV